MSLIKNYGLFWRRDQVYWGKQKSSGHLLGLRAAAKRETPINFRTQRGIYVLYDDTFSIVYVGQAGKGQQNLFERLRTHTRDHLSSRWSRFSWFGLGPVREQQKDVDPKDDATAPNRTDILNQFEAILILSAEPKLNRRGGNITASQYLQFRDAESLGMTSDQKLDALLANKKGA